MTYVLIMLLTTGQVVGNPYPDDCTELSEVINDRIADGDRVGFSVFGEKLGDVRASVCMTHDEASKVFRIIPLEAA